MWTGHAILFLILILRRQSPFQVEKAANNKQMPPFYQFYNMRDIFEPVFDLLSLILNKSKYASWPLCEFFACEHFSF